MDPFVTPGAFSWCELMTTDAKAATEFYSGLFGWSVQTMPMPQGDYHVLKVGDAMIGGIMAIPKEAQGMPPNWGAYVTVEDVDATVRRCQALGGRVCHPPQEIPGVGRFAVIADPQGATLNVVAYDAPQG